MITMSLEKYPLDYVSSREDEADVTIIEIGGTVENS
jgi:hypothetical protein